MRLKAIISPCVGKPACMLPKLEILHHQGGRSIAHTWACQYQSDTTMGLQVADLLAIRTKPQIAVTYRSVGSGNSQIDFLGSSASSFAVPRTAFGSGDVPMDPIRYQNITSSGNPMVHVPFLVGAVSFFHNVPGVGKVRQPLHAACTLSHANSHTFSMHCG